MEKKEEEVILGDFDPHVVHYRDPLTMRVTRVNAYRMIVSKGTRYYEWPKASGNLWYEDRHPAGKLDEKGEIVLAAEHTIWVAPLSVDEALGVRNATLEQENIRIKAELTAIKKEQEGDKAIAADAALKSAAKRVVSTKAMDKPEVVSGPTVK